MIAIHRFKQKNSFQQDDVDVAKRVIMLAESRRGLLREIRFHIDVACTSVVRSHLRTSHRIELRFRRNGLPNLAGENGYAGDSASHQR